MKLIGEMVLKPDGYQHSLLDVIVEAWVEQTYANFVGKEVEIVVNLDALAAIVGTERGRGEEWKSLRCEMRDARSSEWIKSVCGAGLCVPLLTAAAALQTV